MFTAGGWPLKKNVRVSRGSAGALLSMDTRTGAQPRSLRAAERYDGYRLRGDAAARPISLMGQPRVVIALGANAEGAAARRRAATPDPPRVVVDVREFRSSLPSMLHAAGMRLTPVTLTVGDFVVTNSLVVERKSVSDLSSSSVGRFFLVVR